MTESAAQVDGHTLTLKDWTYAYTMLNAASISPQQAKEIRLKETIMDLLIDRELWRGRRSDWGFAWATMRSRT